MTMTKMTKPKSKMTSQIGSEKQTRQKPFRVGRTFSLGSSSEGNSFYIELYRNGYPKPFRLLIECGFSYSTISTKLLQKGVGMNDLDAILVTHEHFDHSQCVPELVDRGKDVYAPETVFKRFDLLTKIDKRKHIIHERTPKGIADGIQVLGLPLEHEDDSGENIYNLAYIITINDEFNILFATDTKYIKWDLSEYKFNVIFIEANFMRNVIYFALKQAKLNNERFKMRHYERVLNSHFCVDNTAKTLSTFDLSETEIIYLIHLTASSTVNPQDFKKIVRDKIRPQMRRVKYIKNGEVRKVLKPRIIVVKKRGEFV